MAERVTIYKSSLYPSTQQALSVKQTNGTPTATTIAGPTQVNSGGTVGLSGTISPTPTGTVTIQKLSGTSWVNVSTVAISTLLPGTWSYTAPAISVQTTYRAIYNGDATYQASTSSSKIVKCWGKLPAVTITPSLTDANYYYRLNTNVDGTLGNNYTGTTKFANLDTTPSYLALGVDANNGKQASAFTFNYTTLSNLTSDCYITSVNLSLNATGWAVSSGGTVKIWFNLYFPSYPLPTSTSDVLEFYGVDGTDNVTASWSTKTGSKTISLNKLNWTNNSTASVTSAGVNNTIWHYGLASGITLYVNNSTSIYDGTFSTNPSLSITYYKYGYLT
jgi:hypothetical protein